MFAAHSKDYLTELVASVAAASPQHHSVDQLADFVLNLVVVPSTVAAAAAAAAVKEYWAADAAEKAVDAWTAVLVAAAASQQIAEVAGVMMAQIVVQNSIDFVEYHSE